MPFEVALTVTSTTYPSDLATSSVNEILLIVSDSTTPSNFQLIEYSMSLNLVKFAVTSNVSP